MRVGIFVCFVLCCDWCLAQCLAHRRCSVYTCGMSEQLPKAGAESRVMMAGCCPGWRMKGQENNLLTIFVSSLFRNLYFRAFYENTEIGSALDVGWILNEMPPRRAQDMEDWV